MGKTGCPFGPHCPHHPLHPRQDGLCRGSGYNLSRPATQPGTPGPNFRLASFKSPRVPHLLLCLLRGAPPGWRYRRPRPSARRPRKFDKDQGRGRDRDPRAEAGVRRAISRDPVPASRWQPGRKARRPAGQGDRPAGRRLRAGSPGRAGRRPGCGRGEGLRAGPALRPQPQPAPAPAASPSPGLPLPTSRPVPFVPVCCGDSSPGWAIPPAHLSPPGARRARGPARPAARARDSAP